MGLGKQDPHLTEAVLPTRGRWQIYGGSAQITVKGKITRRKVKAYINPEGKKNQLVTGN